ncbi:two-component system regulatory protein YycI [Bacillus sp. 2205SS5-2]|uniref:two-component system regulatory protein YycI n=1 Tax=Bacillus sp. 2205SS5-2 TaxID=3109031 RepID=UPI0030075944
MDWNRTKTIFIIVFTVLNIFLITLLAKKLNAQYENLHDPTIEEQLAVDNITYGSLDKLVKKEPRISAKTKKFLEEDLIQLEMQEISLINNNTKIKSILKEPYSLGEEFNRTKMIEVINQYIFNGNIYRFGYYDETNKIITYFQVYNNKPLYKNRYGHIDFYLNDDFEVVSYEQTMLTSIESYTEEEDILPAIDIIEVLRSKGKLRPDSEIVDMEIGYHTLVQLTESQVLTPTWHFVVEHESVGVEHLYVNAIEGTVLDLNSNEEKVE